MAPIVRISLLIFTGRDSNAGIDTGAVFFGIGGREFRIDSSVDPDFRPSDGSGTVNDPGRAEFIIGGPVSTQQRHRTLRNPDFNDLGDYVLLTEHLDRFPAYIRFDPGDSEERWQIEQVNVNINILVSIDPPQQTTAVQYQNLAGANSLWLGNRMGHYLYLRRTL